MSKPFLSHKNRLNALLMAITLAAIAWAPPIVMCGIFLGLILGTLYELSVLFRGCWRWSDWVYFFVLATHPLWLPRERAGDMLLAVLVAMFVTSLLLASPKPEQLSAEFQETAAKSCAALLMLVLPGFMFRILQHDHWRFDSFFIYGILAFRNLSAAQLGRFWKREHGIPISQVNPDKLVRTGLVSAGAAMALGCILSLLAPAERPLWVCAFSALVLSACGQFGDLLGSFLKRFFGVKDSSNILGPRGGFIDLMDNYILAPGCYLLVLSVTGSPA